jgi:tRNA modification GTPase
MLARLQDPIIAIATAPGRGAVGIVRLSAPTLEPLILALFDRSLPPRVAVYGPFRDAQGRSIDQGLALYFPAPHSYTGEDVLELQAHGGPIVLQLLLARCLELAAQSDAVTGQPLLSGLRLAEPGEFTRRAFLNDKMDLAQAEAVSDLIDASTEAAARSAARSLGGDFSRLVGLLAERLIRLRMLVEATLDFPEEEIDFLEQADAQGQLTRIREQLAAVLDQARQGTLLREGLRVVIAGQPNAGKSSLLNALAGAELAIVTPIPGTTRDRISSTIQIEGVPIHVMDTAGLRELGEQGDEVERIGIERSWDAIASADVVVLLHDLGRLDQPEYRAAEEIIRTRLPASVHRLQVWNKADLLDETEVRRRIAGFEPDGPNQSNAPEPLILSARKGQGLDALRQALLAQVGWHAVPEGVFLARSRHVEALRRAGLHLQWAEEQIRAVALDLLAEELRLAHNALGEITGAFSADDLLGEIFSRFCIGK